VSTIGDRIVTVALALFVTDLTGSATDLGVVLAAYTGSLVCFLLLGGVWADRLPRHRLMVVCDLVRFGLHAGLALLILSAQVEVWHVVAIEVCFGAAEAFFRPAYTGLIPQTVPEDLIQQANSLSATATNVAELLGPALATALVVGLGAGYAFAIDSATFLVSAALLLLVHPRRRGQPAARKPMLADLREGFGEVRSRAWVWVTITVFSVALMAGLAPLLVLGPGVAELHYGTHSAFGVIFSAFGAGMVLGAVVGLAVRPSRPMLSAFFACAGWPAMMAAFAVGLPLPAVVAVSVAGGLGIALFGIWWETALAQRIPSHALSRVASYDWMGSFALAPIGYLAAGPLAEVFGAPEVMLVGAGLTLLLLAAGLIPAETRRLRRIEPGAVVAPASRISA
jgi:MFS family permease